MMLKPLRRIRILVCVLLACSIFLWSAGVQAAGKIYTEQELRALGIYFVGDENTKSVTTTVSGEAHGTGACFELPLPQINDQAAFAKAIDDYLQQNAPDGSPFQGLGADLVQGAVRNGVNPLFEVGNMRVESQYGTSGTGGGTSISELLHQHNNAFGRTAGGTQPQFADKNGRAWYAYPSWKESVNSPTSSDTNTTDQPSLMKKVYLNAGVISLSQYLAKYAPATDGNDESAYGQAVNDTIQKIVALAGSSLGCQDNSTVITPATPAAGN